MKTTIYLIRKTHTSYKLVRSLNKIYYICPHDEWIKCMWDLNMLYIVDVEDSVQVDKDGKRSDKKPERDLLFNGNKFINDMEDKGIKVELVTGGLEKITLKAAEEINPNLIIVGREQKKKGVLGLPIKHLKRKLAEKCKYSLLFVN